MKKYFPIVSLSVLTLLSTCNPPAEVESGWTDTPVACDGDTARWNNVMQYPDDPQFGIGVKNDGTFLYLSITSWKRAVNRQLLRFGFTAWFTSPSKKGKRFGILFPIGMMRNSAAWHSDRRSMHDPEAMKERMEAALQEMELLGPEITDSVPVKTAVAESFGLAVRMFPSDENLIYEIKVPLRQDSVSKYALEIGNDSLLLVTFESTVPDVDTRNRGDGAMEAPHMGGGGGGMSGGGRPGGGMGGGGRGMHGNGRGGHAEPSAEEMPASFNASFSIRLARNPAK